MEYVAPYWFFPAYGIQYTFPSKYLLFTFTIGKDAIVAYFTPEIFLNRSNISYDAVSGSEETIDAYVDPGSFGLYATVSCFIVESSIVYA